MTNKDKNATCNKIAGIKGVIFDFDETLVDSMSGYRRAWDKVAEAMREYIGNKGIRISKRQLRKEIEKINLEMDRKRQYNRDLYWLPVLLKFIGKNPPDSILKKFSNVYWKATMEGSKLLPDALSTLRYLKENGYCLALLSDTDGEKSVKRKRIHEIGLETWFDVVVVAGEDIKEAKPDPAPYLLVCKKMNLKHDECVFVGDKPFTDIKGAKAAGIKSILVLRRKWKNSTKPDVTIKNLSELKKIL